MKKNDDDEKCKTQFRILLIQFSSENNSNYCMYRNRPLNYIRMCGVAGRRVRAWRVEGGTMFVSFASVLHEAVRRRWQGIDQNETDLKDTPPIQPPQNTGSP